MSEIISNFEIIMRSQMIQKYPDSFKEALRNSIGQTSSEILKQLWKALPEDFDRESHDNELRSIASTIMSFESYIIASERGKLLSAEWFKYVGRPIDDTRPFCRERAGQFFHRKEIESWGSLTWEGQIEGTNSSNIFSFAGGWGCRHIISPVSEFIIPKDVLLRNIENGNYTPNEWSKKKLGL